MKSFFFSKIFFPFLFDTDYALLLYSNSQLGYPVESTTSWLF